MEKKKNSCSPSEQTPPTESSTIKRIITYSKNTQTLSTQQTKSELMIPTNLLNTLEHTARTTFDEAKEAFQHGNNEVTALQTKQQAIKDLEENTEFSIIGKGTGRVAVTHTCFGQFVVKIALYSPRNKAGFSIDGVSQNQQELWTWDNLPESLQHRFTPVESIHANGRLLVMPTVTTNEEEIPYGVAEEFMNETKLSLYNHDWDAIELDIHTIGKRNGELEVFDYGLPVEPSESLSARGDDRIYDYRKGPRIS